MSKNNSKKQNEEYTLKKDAVERLANANKKTAKKVSDEELNKYQKPFLPNVPLWAKAAFIKWWFAGAICFFFFWGLGTYLQSQLDLLFVLWIGLGVITDLLTNNVLRFIQNEHEYEPYIMFPSKKYITFVLNILYALPLLLGTVLIYEGVNRILMIVTNAAEGTVPLGVEPIGFGLFYMLIDFLFLTIRNQIKKKTAK